MPRRLCWSGPARGCFVLESDEAAATGAARAVLRGLARLPRDLRRRTRARSTRPRRASGTARRLAEPPISARRGSTRARASPTRPTARRSCRRSRRSPPRTGGCSPASRRRASSRAATAARPGRCSPRSRASRAARAGTTRRTSRRAISASPRIASDPDDDDRFWAIVPGHRALRDDRRRRDVDAAQPGPARRLAARARGGRLLRPQARPVAGRPRPHVPAEPRRHAPQRRRRPHVDGDHRRASRPSSASPPRRTRTTATRST